MRNFITPLCLLMSFEVQANDYLENKRWRDDFTEGLWKGCIDKTIVQSGYFAEFGNISKEYFENPRDPYLIKIKEACSCQTKYFEENYSTENLKEILSGPKVTQAFSVLAAGLAESCN
ncbi:hypothetical protein ACJJIR_12395 [Microbulbifer sp. SSSA008]|uniref:hypothetical protein n=1 Tax=unclassified Microbulbifer TaxID=2619833 RepID=UPI004039C31C